ncbi:white-brown-complex ABC transporter family [Anopheles sinensis]|uniref:White-brown-complex ABC transporter family n=1 Tax=Anopheles sinensis TaxID=74873 RepID=A0A084VRV7_ANOSI|nr:white-brown-complex ABC transporter family [Anopheles sinensis]
MNGKQFGERKLSSKGRGKCYYYGTLSKAMSVCQTVGKAPSISHVPKRMHLQSTNQLDGMQLADTGANVP